MSTVLQELVQQLALERLEEDLFRGQSHDIGSGRVFGGQVLGQALSAAVQTVPAERQVHSLHAYFLRPGDVRRPILYEVDRIRDGASFTTRRVVAIQGGKPIFHLAASFQTVEQGFEHQDPMPEVPAPEELPTEQELVSSVANRLPRPLRERALAERPFILRPLDPDTDLFLPEPRPPRRTAWLKAAAPLPDDPGLHRYLLLYASDYAFITTALRPHGVTWLSPGMQVASLDHAMWFHQPFRVDEWLLYVMESPTAHGARGIVRGRIFSRDGRLVASTVQEGLIRQHAQQP
ncbi:acyl-CoA thioesterase II [Chondromyces crocatus]|uniref:Acyl-CoA thioesterase 2 n=1 Tax=Chondromyces crocatus TaxID=52 RepID=A0A0K1E9R5_CHOCO|nr:acyl-CoA thioesterase II [Chondromyces crocatus]AKT37432.1 acyl-CoA thioesterase [Chondromyces crocatus]